MCLWIQCGVHNITHVLFLPKMFNLNLIMKKHWDKSRVGGIPKGKWPGLLRRGNIIKNQAIKNIGASFIFQRLRKHNNQMNYVD